MLLQTNAANSQRQTRNVSVYLYIIYIYVYIILCFSIVYYRYAEIALVCRDLYDKFYNSCLIDNIIIVQISFLQKCVSVLREQHKLNFETKKKKNINLGR